MCKYDIKRAIFRHIFVIYVLSILYDLIQVFQDLTDDKSTLMRVMDRRH